MILHSMTATFGKLQNSTLTLQPGLNVIHAPNEWGKSTWCAFLVAMLYGIDTRQRTTETVLADKERYAPWSGQPMSGRLELTWQGRQITIERGTKGRIPLGQFRAYETDSGLPVPELTAETCGKQLLGVEKEVFLRAGFLRLTDLPVTPNDALRRRLNALVTTGDESGRGEQLAAKLQKLKNTVRSNSKTGLLPQEQAKLQDLQQKLAQQRTLAERQEQLTDRCAQMQAYLAQLRDHRDLLESQAARENQAQLALVRARQAELAEALAQQEAACRELPDRESLRQKLASLEEAVNAQQALYMELKMLPLEADPPVAAFCQPGEEPTQVAARLKGHIQAQKQSQAAADKKLFPLWLFGLFVAAGGFLWWPLAALGGLLTVILGAVCVRGSVRRQAARRRLEELQLLYGGKLPTACQEALEEYEKAYALYRQQRTSRSQELTGLRQRYDQQAEHLRQLTGGRVPETVMAELRDALSRWDALADLRREQQRQGSLVRTLAVKEEKPVAASSGLSLSLPDTLALIADQESRLRQGQQELARVEGQRDALGQIEDLEKEEAQAKARIAQLEQRLAALELALSTLAQATAALQKRFAPRISQRAGQLLSGLTDGRYQRLALDEQLNLQVSAQDEAVLRDPLWRSDGTADQLYVALRLAVAEVLTPQAPLVLDDALVRFDDTRLKAALRVLQEAGETRQVILFTCQEREQNML